jgi:hypothetical protein
LAETDRLPNDGGEQQPNRIDQLGLTHGDDRLHVDLSELFDVEGHPRLAVAGYFGARRLIEAPSGIGTGTTIG